MKVIDKTKGYPSLNLSPFLQKKDDAFGCLVVTELK